MKIDSIFQDSSKFLTELHKDKGIGKRMTYFGRIASKVNE